MITSGYFGVSSINNSIVIHNYSFGMQIKLHAVVLKYWSAVDHKLPKIMKGVFS